MPRYAIYTYNMGSRSAKALQEALRPFLRTIRVYPDGTYRPHNNDTIINWGNGTIPSWYREGLNFLNKPENVQNAQNKLSTLNILNNAGISTVEFTTDINIARTWDIIYARTLLRGSQGRGITVINQRNGDRVITAPLYTKYIKPDAEYRVHVFCGEVIDYTKKVRIDGNEINDNDFVRNLDNGWTFARGGYAKIEQVKTDAINAVRALGLDFGSVDIMRSNRNNYVLEVNTASGLSQMGIEAYVMALRKMYYR